MPCHDNHSRPCSLFHQIEASATVVRRGVRCVDGMSTRRRIPLQSFVAVLAFCILWIALGSRIVPIARRHDFLNLYTGASMALRGDFAHLHSPAAQLERERRFVPDLPVLVPFVRPPFYALLLAPLALLPYGTAFWVWLVFQSLLLFGCWAWAFFRWGPDALIFGGLFLPTALGIASGQDCVVLLVIVIATYSLSEKGHPLGSGLALGLGLIKFHLFLLWPVALIVQKRWRMLLGACIALTAELAVSLGLSGLTGLRAYFDLLRNKNIERLSPSPELMINVHSLVLNISLAWNLGISSLVVPACFIALVAVLVIAASWRAPLWRWIAAASLGSLLVPPHVYGYDAALLLLPLWLAIFCSTDRWTRTIAALVVTPLPYLANLAGAPWAATAPISLLVFLAILSRPGPKESASSTLASSESSVPDISREVPRLAETHPLV